MKKERAPQSRWRASCKGSASSATTRRLRAAGLLAALLLGLVGLGAPAASASASARGPRAGTPWVERAKGGNAKLSAGLLPAAATGAQTAASGPTEGITGLRPAAVDGRRDVVVEGDDAAALTDAVAATGGEVLTSAPGAVRADVPEEQLATLAADPAVSFVREPRPLRPDTTSEAVTTTGAGAWQPATTGAGVKVGIVDVGFNGYAAKVGATGELGSSVVTQNFCGTGTTGFDGSGPTGLLPTISHGTAVAEIVHDMAPGATLYLVCVFEDTDFTSAEQYLAQQGVTIVNASIGSALSGRGDGGSGVSSAAVKAGREAGQLWTVAAGNMADRHYGATMTDRDGDSAMELFGGASNPAGPDAAEDYTFTLAPGQTSIIQLKWDGWPTTTYDFDLAVFVDVIDANHLLECGTGSPNDIGGCNDQGSSPSAPVEEAAFTNNTASTHTFHVFIVDFNGAPGSRADLYFLGQEANLKAVDPSQSLSDPATSPFAMTVGAACFSGTTIESFSSRGPTIDGRVKPDITGPDGTASSVYSTDSNGCAAGVTGGFYGTSAAAPHTAGAAALLKQANPALDASQLQAILEARAQDAGAPGKDSTYGAGLLRLGAAGTPTSPTPQPFHGITPVRVTDTRAGFAPVSNGDMPLGQGQSWTQSFGTAGVPGNATAVVLNVTETLASASSWFTVWPTGAAQPNASNLNFGPGQTVANSVTVALGTNGQVTFANALGAAHLVVDLVGWYAPAAEAGFRPVNPPRRALDTRSVGGAISGGTSRDVQLRNATFEGFTVPVTATAVALNVTAVSPTQAGYLTIWPKGATMPNASSLNFSAGATVANLVVATIGTANSVSFFNSSGGTNIVVDVMGYYDPTAGGDGYVPLPAPVRDLDSRTGNGPRNYPILGGQPFDLDVGGVYGVPGNAPAVLLNLTTVSPSGPGFLSAYPSGAAVPSTSNLNFVAGQTVPNAAIVSLGTLGRASIYIQSTSLMTHVISDLQGYFMPFAG